MWPQTGLPRDRAAAMIAWLRSSPRVTGTKSIFSPSGARLRPAVEDPADLLRRQVAAGGLELGRGRRHGARHGEEDRQRRLARILEHHLDARGVEDVADLVAVAEDRGGAVEERRLGIGAGGHHARFDVDMRVDQPRRDDPAARRRRPCPACRSPADARPAGLTAAMRPPASQTSRSSRMRSL